MKSIKIFILLAFALAALIFCTGGRGLTGRAYSYIWPTYSVERVSHTVHHGDTLYSIAYLYVSQQDRWDDLRGIVMDIKQANGLGDGDVYWLDPGRKIIVPLQREVKQ